MRTKQLWFDMDGTVADLYGSEGWLDKLRAEEPGVYDDLRPLYDPEKLRAVCLTLMGQGWQLGIITWLGMGASDEYEERSTEEKKLWRDKYMPYITEFHAQRYGTPKQYAPARRAGIMILVDDNKDVREMWDTAKQRKSIDPTDGNLIDKLWELVGMGE